MQTDNQFAKHCTDEGDLSPSNPERVDAAQGVWSLHKMGGNAHCKINGSLSGPYWAALRGGRIRPVWL